MGSIRPWAYSTKFSILLAVCLEQDLGKERVEERETGVMTEEREASLEEVDAISRMGILDGLNEKLSTIVF